MAGDQDGVVDGRGGSSDASGGEPAPRPAVAVSIRSQKLVGSVQPRSNFGGEVAVSGDTIAVASSPSRVIELFQRTPSGWVSAAAVETPNVGNCGTDALALDGDLAAVGAHSASTPGWVHVLRRTAGTWAIEARIDDPSADAQAEFGSAVAISGDTIVVGARRNHDGSPGSVHVFVKRASGWQLQATLTSWDAESDGKTLGDDQFGLGVAIAGDTLAVARPWSERKGAIVYLRDSDGVWRRELAFPPDDAPLDQPIALALSADRLLMGDNGHRRAHLYLRNGVGTWSSEEWFTAQPDYNLGYSVALGDNLAVVGTLAEAGREAYGNAYAFVRNNGGGPSLSTCCQTTVRQPRGLGRRSRPRARRSWSARPGRPNWATKSGPPTSSSSTSLPRFRDLCHRSKAPSSRAATPGLPLVLGRHG